MACKPIGISRAENIPYFSSKSANGGMRGGAVSLALTAYQNTHKGDTLTNDGTFGGTFSNRQNET